jgi:hypothetical protein
MHKLVFSTIANVTDNNSVDIPGVSPNKREDEDNNIDKASEISNVFGHGKSCNEYQ